MLFPATCHPLWTCAHRASCASTCTGTVILFMCREHILRVGVDSATGSGGPKGLPEQRPHPGHLGAPPCWGPVSRSTCMLACASLHCWAQGGMRVPGCAEPSPSLRGRRCRCFLDTCAPASRCPIHLSALPPKASVHLGEIIVGTDRLLMAMHLFSSAISKKTSTSTGDCMNI